MPDPRNQKADKGERVDNVYHIWTDAQRGWVEAWKHMSEVANHVLRGGSPAREETNFYDVWAKSYREATDSLLKFPPSGSLRPTLEMFLTAVNSYLKMYRVWVQVIEQSRNGKMVPMGPETIRAWSEAVKEWLGGLAGGPLPEALKSSIGPFNEASQTLLRMWTENVQMGAANYSNYMVPWMGVWEDLGKEATAVFGGKPGLEASRRVQDSWLSTYQKTIGKFFTSPAIGPTRVTTEKALRAVDSFFKYCGATIDFYFRIYEPAIRAFDTVAKKSENLFKGKITPETFREFYELALQVYEETFHQMFKSESFSRGMQLVLNSMLEYRQNTDALIEALLKDTPIVTQSEIAEVYKELFLLKKKVREQEKQLREMKRA